MPRKFSVSKLLACREEELDVVPDYFFVFNDVTRIHDTQKLNHDTATTINFDFNLRGELHVRAYSTRFQNRRLTFKNVAVCSKFLAIQSSQCYI